MSRELLFFSSQCFLLPLEEARNLLEYEKQRLNGGGIILGLGLKSRGGWKCGVKAGWGGKGQERWGSGVLASNRAGLVPRSGWWHLPLAAAEPGPLGTKVWTVLVALVVPHNCTCPACSKEQF